MKYLIIIFLFCITLISIKSYGQSIDESRMQKDIEVTEAILNEIFNHGESSRYVANENYRYFIDKKEVESTGVYVEKYGVIFKVPQSTQKLDYVVIDGKRIVTTSKSGTLKLKATIDGQRVKKFEKDGVTFFYINEEGEVNEDETITLEKWKEAINKKQEEYIANTKIKIENFFRSYADLIGQLKPNDKIMLVSQSAEKNVNWPYSYKVKSTLFQYDREKDDVKLRSLTAELIKSDLIAFKSGKLSEEEFMKKINYSEENNEDDSKIEYNVLAGVFEKLFENIDFIYKGKTSKFDAPNVRYERLYNFGIIYEISTNTYRFSGNSSRKELVFMDGKMETIKADEKEEYLEEVKEKQEEFISQIKEYMVQYGRTLKSLNPNEILMLEVVLNSNNMINSSRFWDKTDDTTKKIKLTISKVDLDSYDKGTISFEDAVAKVKVKEY